LSGGVGATEAGAGEIVGALPGLGFRGIQAEDNDGASTQFEKRSSTPPCCPLTIDRFPLSGLSIIDSVIELTGSSPGIATFASWLEVTSVDAVAADSMGLPAIPAKAPFKSRANLDSSESFVGFGSVPAVSILLEALIFPSGSNSAAACPIPG
jgi:hypothetical protein